MIAKYSKAIIMLYMVTLAQSQYLNLQQYPEIPHPVAYNLHRLTEPRNVNDLSDVHLQRAKHDVSTTIGQVQRLLALDPNLPRLTRGEIEELFENVTKEEYERSLRLGDHDRAKHMRALMLVLPYNTNNSSNGNLEELYTKPPITRMIDPSSDSKSLTVTMTKPPVIKFNLPAPQKSPQILEREKLQPISSTYKETTIHRPKKPIVPVGIKTTKAPFRVTPMPTEFRPVQIVGKATQTAPKYDEPVIMAIQKKNNNKFSSHYSVNASPFMPSADSSKTTQLPMRENVKDLLGAIGLYPDAELKLVKPSSTHPMIHHKKISETPLTIATTTSMPTTSSVKPTEITPELKGLLQSFGFLNEADKKYKFDNSEYHEFKPLPDSLKDSNLFITPYVSNHPDIVSDDFSAFKPIQFDENIPAKNNVDPEFENLLKSFGLIDFNQKRAKKSMSQDIGDYATSTTTTTTQKPATTSTVRPAKMRDIPPVAVDMLPSSMIKILDNLGIATKKHNHNYDNASPTLPKIDIKQSRKLISKKAHGFRLPNQTTDEEDYEKLKQLLETIKQLDKLNANLSDDEISKLNLKHYNLSDTLLAHGPDPLDNIELLNKKNEVKRQDNSSDINKPVRISLSLTETERESAADTTVASVVTTENSTPNDDQTTLDENQIETTTSVTTTTTTEEISRAETESSFANGADPVTEEPLPPPRRNGFYFLQDINKFLEVGEEPDIVEVRYERKFGDPSRFLPITVP